MSNISITVTDTTMGPMEAKYETAPGLSIGTMIFDLGWPWTVLVQGHQNCTSNIFLMMTDTESIRQTSSSLSRTLSCCVSLLLLSWLFYYAHFWYNFVFCPALSIMAPSTVQCSSRRKIIPFPPPFLFPHSLPLLRDHLHWLSVRAYISNYNSPNAYRTAS